MKSRLTAVAFADIAGYTTLVHADAPGTVAAWHALRRELLLPHLRELGGRLVDRAGDGILVEFQSTANAVAWALRVQAAMRDQGGTGTNPPLAVRIGIDVDDVVIDADDRPVGGGIAVAARIQALAQPGEVLVTDTVRKFASNMLPLRFVAHGPQRLRNVPRPVRVFRVEPDPTGRINRRDTPAAPERLLWPTIAVLPFVTMGAGEGDQYYGEGITEDIISALGRTGSMFVIAHTSTLHYANRHQTGAELQRTRTAIAAELGVRYLLDGSVQRHGNELLIRAELADVETARSLWTGRMHGTADRLFEFQAAIARSIVGALEPRLLEAEAERVQHRDADQLDAYDCVLRGMSLLYRFDDSGFEESGRLFSRAVQLDSTFARGYAYLAWWRNFRLGEERSDERHADTALAVEAAQRAYELDPKDPFVLAVAGHIQAFLRRNDDVAIELFNRALELNPCSAFAWAISAPTYSYRGQPRVAIDRIQIAQELSPKDPMLFKYRTSEGIAWFVSGEYERSIELLRLARIDNRRYNACNRVLAAALALAGRIDEARGMAAEYLEQHPHFSVARFEKWYPLQPPDMGRLALGLRLAGLPD